MAEEKITSHPPLDRRERLGKVAYDAYRAMTTEAMSEWRDLAGHIQIRWIEVAHVLQEQLLIEQEDRTELLLAIRQTSELIEHCS